MLLFCARLFHNVLLSPRGSVGVVCEDDFAPVVSAFGVRSGFGTGIGVFEVYFVLYGY